MSEKNKFVIYKSIGKRKPFIFLALACGVLFLSTTLSPEAGKNIANEDGLIENMTMGRNAVGYLTESVHGAGSPQAQRIQIGRMMQLEYKKRLAKVLAGIPIDMNKNEVVNELGDYFERVFNTK